MSELEQQMLAMLEKEAALAGYKVEWVPVGAECLGQSGYELCVWISGYSIEIPFVVHGDVERFTKWLNQQVSVYSQPYNEHRTAKKRISCQDSTEQLYLPEFGL